MKSVLHPRDREELRRRLRSVSPESSRQWGLMSPHQMLCHLGDIYRVGLGERRATPVGNAIAHTVIKRILLSLPVPIPRGRPTAAELDPARDGTRPGEFIEDTRMLEDLIERFAAGAGPAECEHPFFGQMSRDEWGRFHYKHTDYHLRQFGV